MTLTARDALGRDALVGVADGVADEAADEAAGEAAARTAGCDIGRDAFCGFLFRAII